MSEQQTIDRARGFPVTSLLVIKWRGTASIRSRVVVDHCWKTSSSLRTNTTGYLTVCLIGNTTYSGSRVYNNELYTIYV